MGISWDEMKAGMKAEQQTGSRDLKQTRQTDRQDRQTTQQTRSCSQRQRDVGEGSNTLLLIPLLLCCEEPQFPFKWWTIPLMIAVKYTHANTHTHTRTHTHPHTHTHTLLFPSAWQEMWFRARRDEPQFNFYNLRSWRTLARTPKFKWKKQRL